MLWVALPEFRHLVHLVLLKQTWLENIHVGLFKISSGVMLTNVETPSGTITTSGKILIDLSNSDC